MGQSTDGQISYGIAFEEGFEFPWDLGDSDGDIEDWWLAESGWKWEGEEPFTEDRRDYAPGMSSEHPTVRAYFASMRAWKDAHPGPPVELVNYCSGDYPMYALVVPSSVRTASRGGPEIFDPAELTVTEKERAALLGFCEKYGIEHDDEPAWLLTSYWG